jgi:hypothetical protein
MDYLISGINQKLSLINCSKLSVLKHLASNLYLGGSQFNSISYSPCFVLIGLPITLPPLQLLDNISNG